MPSWSDGVPFAVDADGRFRDVNEVPRGLDCGCVCADCGGRVVAKKGDIYAHHFAHHDRRKCRNALEASLFGMVVTLMKDQSLRLFVPPAGKRCELVPHPEQVFTESQSAAFFKTEWVLPPRQVSVQGAAFATNTLAGSTTDKPDIVLPEISVHIASHLKPMSELGRLRMVSDAPVLAIDLQAYVKIWWEICDANKEERLNQASTATDAMRRWLETSASGRRWLFQPELEKKKDELKVWIRDKSPVAAEWRRQQSKLHVPEVSSAADPDDGAKLVGFVRQLEECHWLSRLLASELGLRWDGNRNRYVAFGAPGATISPTVAKLFDPEDDWRPVYTTEQT